jgi:ATP adenylyltransferase
MDYLWTPWRYQYIVKTGDPGECVFCAAARAADDKMWLVVHRGERNFVILNRFPYTTGHIMVVPNEHVASMEEAADETLVELIRLARECERCLRSVYHPEGLNLGFNIGRSAGAGIAGHIHMHILPRWAGDTNFMTVVSETRVVPEDLDVTWSRLRAAFAGL